MEEKKKHSILIVDDIEDNIISLKFLLELLPDAYEIRSVMNGGDAISSVEENPPDVVLLDINLPDINGYEVCRKIRESGDLPYIPIILLTAYSMDIESKIRGYDFGADDFITKPFIKEELFARIRSVLRLKDLHDRLRDERDMLDAKVKKRTEELSRILGNKELLLKEIHHRVKNNMQIICSLIDLQSMSIKDPGTLDLFNTCQNRIRSMALVHEKLYGSEDFTRIDFTDYITDVIAYLHESYPVNRKNVEIRCNIEKIFLGIDTAIPLALIINELVSNSLKHAFTGDMKGVITIDFRLDETMRRVLTISDNGVGMPEDFRVKGGRSLGLMLVKGLVEQVKGDFRFTRDTGTRYIISF